MASHKTVLITGAASGIGFNIANTFYKSGYQVIMTDKDINLLSQSAKKIGANVIFFALDVTNKKQWASTINEIISQTGKINCLINNAGIGSPNDIENIDEDHWDLTLDINLKGVMWGCHFGLTEITKCGGSIINIASIIGNKPLSNTPAYAASKAGVISLTKTTALWAAENNYPVRCNTILPGFIRTAMMDQAIKNSDDPESTLAGFKKLSPMNDLVSTQGIADMALFLDSDSAQHITGAEFVVDAGYCI
ncbi:MAG: SDR family oxidoreductase [Alteromonadales bacterium]|nr:SDR family oxidoreductase [Alteromonadales bacterium]MCP4987053.1 SDR family oxidoreductase [Colwellia sp.]